MLIDCLQVLNTEEEKKLFTEIYEKEHALLLKYALHKLGNQTDAEDAVAEAFLRLAKNFQKYSQKTCSELHKILVIIVRNIIIDKYRVSDRMVCTDEGDKNFEAFFDRRSQIRDLSGNPEEKMISLESAKKLLAAIDTLSPELKQVFLKTLP